nr:hypothetical protein [Tanacetum cinerariifolium]
PGVLDGQAFQKIIPNNVAFQTKNLDTYDSDCDDISNAKAALMANISIYGSDIISEVPHSKTYLNDMENQKLLVYVQDACPNAIKLSAKKVAVTPKTKIKKVRILQTPSRNMKNKVEAQPRKVNNKNLVVEPICDVDVKHSLLKANSKLICATCKKSMFDDVHDMCLLDFVENVNSRAGNEIFDITAQIPSTITIVPGMF